eukprot:3131988-Rhodomonas_salina.2
MHTRVLGAYAHAVSSPVLSWCMVLPGNLSARAGRRQSVGTAPLSAYACYAMSGTDIAHGAIGLRACYAMPGTDLVYGATRWRESAVAGSTVSRCMRYAMSGTDIGTHYAMSGTAYTMSGTAYVMSGTDGGFPMRCPVLTCGMLLMQWHTVCCYGLCGTDLRYAAMQSAVLSSAGTEIAYACSSSQGMKNPLSLAPGTILRAVRTDAYAATQHAVLTDSMHLRLRYAMPGTDLDHAATRHSMCVIGRRVYVFGGLAEVDGMREYLNDLH